MHKKKLVCWKTEIFVVLDTLTIVVAVWAVTEQKSNYLGVNCDYNVPDWPFLDTAHFLFYWGWFKWIDIKRLKIKLSPPKPVSNDQKMMNLVQKLKKKEKIKVWKGYKHKMSQWLIFVFLGSKYFCPIAAISGH